MKEIGESATLSSGDGERDDEAPDDPVEEESCDVTGRRPQSSGSNGEDQRARRDERDWKDYENALRRRERPSRDWIAIRR
jgi:hypothetical protein